jgi:hypothetical protein
VIIIGAKLIYPALPDNASGLIGDKGYDSDEFRNALNAKGIAPCILPRRGRNFSTPFDCNFYKQRQKSKISSKTEGLQSDMVYVHIPSSQQSASLHQSSFISINES